MSVLHGGALCQAENNKYATCALCCYSTSAQISLWFVCLFGGIINNLLQEKNLKRSTSSLWGGINAIHNVLAGDLSITLTEQSKWKWKPAQLLFSLHFRVLYPLLLVKRRSTHSKNKPWVKMFKMYASQKSCLCLDTSPVPNVARVTGELSVQPHAGQVVEENGWTGWLFLPPFVTDKVYLACRHQGESPAGLPAVRLGYWQLSVKINLKSQRQVCLPATLVTGSEADCLDILWCPEGWNAEKTREGGAESAKDGFRSWEQCGQFKAIKDN